MPKFKEWLSQNWVSTIVFGVVIVILVGIGFLLSGVIKDKNHKILANSDEIVVTMTPTNKPKVKSTPWPLNEITATPTPEPTIEPTVAPVVTTAPTKKPAKKTPRPTLKPELLAVTVKPNDAEDPANNKSDAQEEMGKGEEVTFDEAVNANETEGTTNGIDVSSHNGEIDWKRVAATGVQFAIIRVGYRGWGSGTIVEDTYAKKNLEGAIANGIRVGAYFFSTAISEQEAIDEAMWTCNLISKYKITYPVAYDCEQYGDSAHRNYATTKTTRTDFAMAFLNEVKEEGYTPMFYNCSNALQKEWETDRIRAKYKIWKANYNPKETIYFENFQMFQYTSSGAVDGISTRVDLNTAYFGYAAEEEAKIATYGMTFTECNDTVYAKKGARLRSVPSSTSSYTIKYTAGDMEPINRVGIGDASWDRVIYNGEIVYVYKSNIATQEQYDKAKAMTPKPSATVKPTASATAAPSATATASHNPDQTNEPITPTQETGDTTTEKTSQPVTSQ